MTPDQAFIPWQQYGLIGLYSAAFVYALWHVLVKTIPGIVAAFLAELKTIREENSRVVAMLENRSETRDKMIAGELRLVAKELQKLTDEVRDIQDGRAEHHPQPVKGAA